MVAITYRHIAELDLPLLHRWRNSECFRTNCTTRGVVTEAEFIAELQGDFDADRCEQMLILRNEKPVGTMYTYRYKPEGYIYFSMYLASGARNHAIGVTAFALWCQELFCKLALRKIYCEVYDYNTSVVKILTRFGLSCERRLEGYRGLGEYRHDLLIFALYRDALEAGILRLKDMRLL